MKKENIRKFIYTVPPSLDNKTILNFLEYLGYSRNIINRVKETNDINLKQIIHTNDSIPINIVEIESSENIEPIKLPLDIIYEDADLIVLNKPDNMPTHPSKNNFDNTLGNALAYYYRDINFVYRPINRLDKDTTGLVLVAKHMLAAHYLSHLVMNGDVSKSYFGIADGDVLEFIRDNLQWKLKNVHNPLSKLYNMSFTINRNIKRESEGSTKRIVTYENDGEEAITEVTVLNYDYQRDLTFCKFKLKTGRTHQIRVHMESIGFPLIGDFLYYPEYTYIKRQALHCGELIFLQPFSVKLLRLTAPLPDDMMQVLL